jgi:ABC-type sugar transport system permease subunit
MTRLGYSFLAPALLVYLIFLIYPLLYNVYLSLTGWDGFSPTKEFLGGANYLELFGDEKFWGALGRNGIWAVVGTIVPMVIGLFLALLLRSLPPGYIVFRTIFFMPQVLAPVAVAIVFGWIYEPNFGILNRLLKALNLDGLAQPWLADPNLALYALIGVAIWVETGFAFVIFVAALQEVDVDLLAAAELDGAGWWRRLWYVMLPQISNSVNLVAAALIIAGFNAFDYVWIMTRGGPAGSTEVASTYLYQVAFVGSRAGYGAAVSTTATVVTMVVVVVVILLRERKEERS